MKILQLIDTLDTGGAERMAVNISNVLANEGYEVGLCVTRRNGNLSKFINSRVQLFELKKKSSFDIITFFKLLSLVKQNNFKVIHAHSTSIYWCVAVKLLFPSLKLIWHDHLGIKLEEDKINRNIIVQLSLFFDSVIVVNYQLKNWAIKRLKIDSKFVLFLKNFPIIDFSKVCKKEKDYIQIVCLANFREQKNHLFLVRAIRQLFKENPNINVKVVLAGEMHFDNYLNELENLIDFYKLQEIIRIIGQVEDIASLLMNSDIGVLSSSSEGLPVALLEYGLAGLPVVCTNVGQCSEVLGDGKFGFVVDVNDVSMFSESIHRLVADQFLRIELGKAFQKHVKVNYGELNFLKSYQQILNSF